MYIYIKYCNIKKSENLLQSYKKIGEMQLFYRFFINFADEK